MKRFNPKHINPTIKNISESDILHTKDKIKTLMGLWLENKERLFKSGYRTLRRNRHWVRVVLTVGLVVSFVILGGISYKAGFYQGVEQWLKLTTKVHQMTAQQDVFEQENLLLNKQLFSLQQQQIIQKIEYQKLSEQVKQSFNENAQLKEDNLLYQHIMSKPHPKRGLAIQRLQLYPTQNTNIFQYQLMLVSNLIHKKLIRGHVEIVVRGKIGGKDISMPIKNLAINDLATPLHFKFKNFQELSGEIVLPNGFEPKSVLVHIMPIQPVKPKTHQIFPWWIEVAKK